MRRWPARQRKFEREQAESWSLEAVIEHWHGLFAGIGLSHRYLGGGEL